MKSLRLLKTLTRRQESSVAPPYEGDRLPLVGHTRALRERPRALLFEAREGLGSVFRLDLMRHSLTVVTGDPADELATRGGLLGGATPLGLLAATTSEEGSPREEGAPRWNPLAWEETPPWPKGSREELARLMTPARLRAPIERFSRILAESLASWPETGPLDARKIFASSRRALMAAFVGEGRVMTTEAVFNALATDLDGAIPAALELLPSLPGRKRRSVVAFERARDQLETILIERRRKPRMASGLFEAWAAILGARRAAELGVRTGWSTLRFFAAQVMAPAHRWGDTLSSVEELLDELLEEQDLLHGDHGGPTFETLQQAKALQRWIDAALAAPARDPLSGGEACWRLVALGRDLRVGRWLAWRGDLLLAPRSAIYFSGAPETIVEETLGRWALVASWSVLMERLDLFVDADEEKLRYHRRPPLGEG